ncbi:MAG: EAL domain-containing protein, partial [Pseudomonadota bacterium]
AQLRKMGLKIALNDFGTGYSSMLFLREFKLDRIKLDSSFMLRMQTENDGEKMIENMISLGTTLGNNVTVEGVETEDMLKKLNALGANEYQGFLFSKPLTVTELIATKMVQEFEAKARLNEKRSDIVPISLYRVN